MPNLCNKSEYSFDMVYTVRLHTITTESKINYLFVFVIEILLGHIYIFHLTNSLIDMIIHLIILLWKMP